MKSKFFALTGIAAGATALTWATYRKEINIAKRLAETRAQLIDSPDGPIEFAESGNGPAVLVVHGAGGGFDQGLDLARAFLGNSFRVIAPSRFGYLGTPLPADASPEAQADAHLRLLDALRVETAPVIAVSAGAPSAMQFCLRHPDRCSALVLIVPLAWQPAQPEFNERPAWLATLLDTLTSSDFLFWLATKRARAALIKTLLGTPIENYRNATPQERADVDRMLRSILPISRRAAGIGNDSFVANTLTPYALEDIHVPTLVIGAADCGYGTFERARYTAQHIRNARFVEFADGGHLLVGHVAEVKSDVTKFVTEAISADVSPAEALRS